MPDTHMKTLVWARYSAQWLAIVVQVTKHSLSSIPRGGVWPVAVSSIPGPKYFPELSAETEAHSSSGHGVGFPKEERFLSNATR